IRGLGRLRRAAGSRRGASSSRCRSWGFRGWTWSPLFGGYLWWGGDLVVCCLERCAEPDVARGSHPLPDACFQPLEVPAGDAGPFGGFLNGQAQALALLTQGWTVHLGGGWGSFHAEDRRVSKCLRQSYRAVTCAITQLHVDSDSS